MVKGGGRIIFLRLEILDSEAPEGGTGNPVQVLRKRSLEVQQDAEHGALVIVARSSGLRIEVQRRVEGLASVESVEIVERVVLPAHSAGNPHTGNKEFAVILAVQQGLAAGVTRRLYVEPVKVIREMGAVSIVENVSAGSVLKAQVRIVADARKRADIPAAHAFTLL